MSLDLANFETQAKTAIKAFWGNRMAAVQKQKELGKLGADGRSAVVAGNNMKGFLVLVEEIIRRNGLKHASICLTKKVVTLPGFFRPTKQWDILILNGKRLVAAIELKSQVGSFGNNFNNRTEEAIGSAVDLLTAYREGALGNQPKPFLGWLMLLEDCEDSRRPVRDSSPHYPIRREFVNCSYADRYNILCQKLVKENLYSGAAFLTSPRTAAKNGKYSELSELTGLRSFLSSLAGHTAAEAASQKLP